MDWSRIAGTDLISYTVYIEPEQQYDLFTIDAGTGVVGRLTSTTSVDERSPSWAPDDSAILFARNGSGSESKNSVLCTVTPSGGR